MGRAYIIRTQLVHNGCIACFYGRQGFFTFCILLASASTVGPSLKRFSVQALSKCHVYSKTKELFEPDIHMGIEIYNLL